MASQLLPRTLQPPPELPNDPKTSDTLAQYLRTFALWCRHGFADKLSISSATPQLMMQTEDVPPAVYQLKVTSDPTLTLTPVALGTGDLGTPVTLTVSTDLDAYMPKSGGTFTGQITAPGISAPQAIGDNRIINGNFAVNQRGQVSGTALAAAAYGHDRWKAGAAGSTYTFTAALPDTTVTITAGTLTQVIEAGMIEGGVYTLSWTGTAQARVYQGTPIGAYAASPITTVSLIAGTNTIVEFNAGSVVRVKLEIGLVATPYNRQSLTKSMADCQRYFVQAAVQYQVLGWANAASGVLFPWSGPVTMRATPTLVAYFSGNNNCSAGLFFVPGGTYDNRTIVGSLAPTVTGQFYATANITSLSAEL